MKKKDIKKLNKDTGGKLQKATIILILKSGEVIHGKGVFSGQRFDDGFVLNASLRVDIKK